MLYGKEYFIEELREDNIKNIDYVLFAAGGDISRKYAKRAVENGAVVIDNSSEFRMDKDVPLIIPEINGDEIKKTQRHYIKSQLLYYTGSYEYFPHI